MSSPNKDLDIETPHTMKELEDLEPVGGVSIFQMDHGPETPDWENITFDNFDYMERFTACQLRNKKTDHNSAL